MVLWFGLWLLRRFVYHLNQLENRKILREVLLTPGLAADPHQQRIVEENVRQRCSAIVPTTAFQDESPVEHRLSGLDDYQYWRGDIESPPVGAYITGTPFVLHTEPFVHPYNRDLLPGTNSRNIEDPEDGNVIQAVGAPHPHSARSIHESVTSVSDEVASDYSYDEILSSIHSSERSGASLFSSMHSDQINSPLSQDDEESHRAMELSPSGINESGSDILNSGSDLYSLPSSISDSNYSD